MAANAKYRTIFKISWQRELEYRFNFFLGRLRSITTMLLLYFVWTSLTENRGHFAGYSRVELFTYVFGISILRSVVFGAQSRQVASDINTGMFSTYLVMPVNFFLRTLASEVAQRSLYAVTAFVEVACFVFFLKVDLQFPRQAYVPVLFPLSVALAMVLYFLLSYAVSLLAFWSREALGPRFLFEWILEFASGAYFPLDILSAGFSGFLGALPFASVLYVPMQLYLGRLDLVQAAQGIMIQMLWIVLFGVITRWVWKRGLRKYTGEGI
jgi:ABC-2 type transport system permease protein